MALTPSASCSLMSQKRPASSLFAGRAVKRPKCGPPLQEAALKLLLQHQSVDDLLTEVSLNNLDTTSSTTEAHVIPSAVSASLLIGELKREAEHRNVSLTTVTAAVLVQRLKELTNTKEEILPDSCRAQLCVLLGSSRGLLSQGALCPKLLWNELTRGEKFPKLEVAFHLHSYNIISFQYILESHGVRPWLVSELKALCSWSPGEVETKRVQRRVLTLVLQVLVGAGFDVGQESVPLNKRLSGLCCSALDHMLFWLLEAVEENETTLPAATGAQTWIELFDTALCGTLVSADALQRFFTHCLTKTLTHQPRLTVSSTITLQNEWTFVKASPLLTKLFCQLTVVFSMEQLFSDLQQILSTHEVNWRHVLSFLSTVLVCNPSAQTTLTELLDVLLKAAFQSYDLESVITAFLLARQGALEGPAVFPSYSDWFKRCFGGSSSPHAASKKALVFLLKFLSDLVPFEPPQYLKVHILHPPFVPMKHRSLLLEYVSLAKTRLADLKESLEDMGLYEHVSAASAEQTQCQEVQDVEKAVSLFESTGRISATVMEASIFRRPYFLTRFLPALLAPRVLPAKADARMKFIEALKKAEKIPPVQFSSYVASCQKDRQKDRVSDSHNSPVDVLRGQLNSIRDLALSGDQSELPAQISKMSHTLSVLCPALSNQTDAVQLHADGPPPDLHVQVVNMVLRSFCQCVLDTSKEDPHTKHISWAFRFVLALTENRAVFSCLVHRLWDLLHNQVSSLGAAHVLGLAVLLVHLHSCSSHCPLVELEPTAPSPVCVTEALCSGLRCDTHAHMLFSLRFCLVAVCYGMCRGEAGLDQIIPSSVYKKLVYLVPRLLPHARMSVCDESMGEHPVPWTRATEDGESWRKSALSLWRDAAFQSLQLKPQFQLTFSEWLHNELQVCRGEDALSDPERQEYHEWVFMELFLPRPEQDGGFGGEVTTLCCKLINSVLDNEVNNGLNRKGTELDIFSRLQACMYEIWLSGHSDSPSHRPQVGRLVFELLSQRLSSVHSASPSTSSELLLHRTMQSWNRMLLALPATLFLHDTEEGDRSALECDLFIKHINQHQRMVCGADNLLACHTTTHFIKGLLCAGTRCREEQKLERFNKAWSRISCQCPLLIVSTVYWWEHMSATLCSMWRRYPQQFVLLSQCHQWAHKVLCGQEENTPSAPSLQLAACLYRALHDCELPNNVYISVLQQEQQTEILVFLLSLCVSRYLSSLLYPEKKSERTAGTCTALLSELVGTSDWLSIFKSGERGVYQPVSMLVSDDMSRLMPWAFYSLLCQQSSEFLHKAVRCPGFVYTAVLCYISLLRLFIDGHTPKLTSNQVEPSQVVVQSKKLLLRCLSQMSGSALSSSQCRQLQDLCAELDPEVTAALSFQHNLSLSPEMDFL
ncbi:Fanconi anemia group A protein-like [Eucyclogobius newberryi]|uniref:Fanconi anemia group A protein-like n=1 Tax=Eucyclogobius newberryi TaxID=166745 RepID=UPI003B59D6E1